MYDINVSVRTENSQEMYERLFNLFHDKHHGLVKIIKLPSKSTLVLQKARILETSFKLAMGPSYRKA